MSALGEAAGRERFAELALEAFAFLLGLGYVVVRREPMTVRLESSTVYINLYHGRSSYALGMEIGRLDRPEIYSLDEVLTTFAPRDVGKARFQAVDVPTLDRCLRSLAAVIERDCSELLQGDTTAFEMLSEVASGSRDRATQQAQFGAILAEADRAWMDHDRDRAAHLYEAAMPALDDMRRRRLAFVRGKDASS